MTMNITTATAPATSLTAERFDNLLVTELAIPASLPISTDFAKVETLRGTFRVAVLANGTIITHADDGSLPFIAQRYVYTDRVPFTVYLPNMLLPGAHNKVYLVNDNPEPGITVDDLNDDDRARVRGERP